MDICDLTPSQIEKNCTRDRFLKAINGISVFERNGQRAVHKPLLTLLALAHLQSRNEERLVFPDIEQKLQELIVEFGTTANSNSPRAHYPFWYLQTDGFWQVENAKLLPPRKSKSAASEPTITTMRATRATGGFTADVLALLKQEPGLLHEAAQVVLTNAFPSTLHLDILIAVGLDGNFVLPATKRDNRFREQVMQAYSYTCAVCGYDGRLGRNPVGLEAAHIRWANVGGPNRISNGLCMCALHHKLFDSGGFTIDADNLIIIVSKRFNGLGEPAKQVRGLDGRRIAPPPRPEEHPLPAHLEWHRSQVFRSS